MEKNDLLAPLFAARTDLTHRLVELSPTDDASRALLHSMMEERDSLNGAINTLTQQQFQSVSTLELKGALDELKASVKSLGALECQIATANQVIGIIGTIVDIAAKAAAIIATL